MPPLPPPNPYIAGKAIDNEHAFFGREDILRQAENYLRHSTNNVIVFYGQRCIGKTSLLLQLHGRLSTPAFIPIYFDLMDKARQPISELLYELAGAIAAKVGLPSPSQADFKDKPDAFQRLFLPTLYQTIGNERRLVLLLDEFDTLDLLDEQGLLETAAVRSFLPYLRYLLQTEPRLAFILSAGRQVEEVSPDFLATFKVPVLAQAVLRLKPAEARGLILETERVGSLYEQTAVAYILALTGGHPYLTQLTCMALFDYMFAKVSFATSRITVADVEAVMPVVMELSSYVCQWIWDGLSPAEQIIFFAMAGRVEKGAVFGEDDITAALRQAGLSILIKDLQLPTRLLMEWQMLEQIGSKYRFSVELMRYWVATHYSLARLNQDGASHFNVLADTFYRAAQGFYRQGHEEQAAQQARQALAIHPNHLRAHLLLGVILRERGYLAEAITEFEAVHQLDEQAGRFELLRALLHQGETLAVAGDEEGALLAYERVLAVFAYEQTARARQAALWEKRGDQALARHDFEAAMKAYQHAGAEDKVAQVKAQKFSLELEQAVKEAQDYEAQEEWIKATEVYRHLIELDPDDWRWRHALEQVEEELWLSELYAAGVSYAQQKDWINAQKTLAKIIAQRPNYKGAAELLVAANNQIRHIQAEVSQMAVNLDNHSNRPLVLPPPPTSTSSISDLPLQTLNILEGHTEPVTSITFSPDGKILASSSEDNTIWLWRMDDGTLLRSLAGHSYGVRSVAFSRDGKILASGAGDATVRLWRVEDGVLLHTLYGHNWVVMSVAFSPDGRLLASSSQDQTIRLWRVKDGTPLHTIWGHTNWVRSIAFSPDSRLLASSSDDNTIRLWRVEDGSLLRILSGCTNWAWSVAFSPDGCLLASGSDDNTLRLWRVDDGTPLHTFWGHTNWVMSVAFSPDGRTLASASKDGTVRLWRVDDGTPLRTLTGHTNWVMSVAFSPDGKILASGAWDDTVRVWGVVKKRRLRSS